jgi:DNA-binding transcriptional LysR family regulator
MLNFNQLRVFMHVAKNMSFTAAAKELYITQPAVTAHMKALEENCNLKLFRKRGRGIYLTTEGEVLFSCVQKVFDYEKEIENVLVDLLEVKKGILRIGTSKTYAKYIMPFLLKPFLKAYPHIKIHLDEGSSDNMMLSLLSFRNELAIVAKVHEHPEIELTPLSQEELVLIMAPEHHLAKRKSVAVKDLAAEPMIMREEGSATRMKVSGLFAVHGCTPNIQMEAASAEFVKQVVARGEAISFLVRESVAIELKENKLVSRPLRGEKVHLDVSIAHLKRERLSPAARAFLSTLEQMISNEKPILGIRALICS